MILASNEENAEKGTNYTWSFRPYFIEFDQPEDKGPNIFP